MKRQHILRWRRRHKPHGGFPPHVIQSKKYKGKVWLYTLLFILTLTISIAGYSYYRFDRRILPLVLASTDMKLKTTINNVIHTEVQEIIRSRDVKATDFYIQTSESVGNNSMLAVNTVLVNDICNASALAISEKLSSLPPEPVSIPIGMVFGLDTLASTGPIFTFNMLPTGNALVNYESKFESVGINQVHFEVWLTVVSVIRIINPSQSATVTVTRDVSLVDTVISGVVPEMFLNVGE